MLPTDGAVAFGGANGKPAGADVNGSDCGSFGDAEEEDGGDQDDAICWGDGQRKAEGLGKHRSDGKPATAGRGREAGKCADGDPICASDNEVGEKAVGDEGESRQNTACGSRSRGV